MAENPVQAAVLQVMDRRLDRRMPRKDFEGIPRPAYPVEPALERPATGPDFDGFADIGSRLSRSYTEETNDPLFQDATEIRLLCGSRRQT